MSISQENNQQNPSPASVKKFVDNNFDLEGTEFDDWTPQDWTKDIPVYDSIQVIKSLIGVKEDFYLKTPIPF